MQINRRHIRILAFAILCLAIGILNYLLFQPGIVVFGFFGLGEKHPIFIPNPALRHFVTGHLSDMAWCTALYLVTLILVERRSLYLSGKWFILFLPFLIEGAQYFGIVPGHFDWFDLLSYLIILFVFFKLYPHLKNIKDEK